MVGLRINYIGDGVEIVTTLRWTFYDIYRQQLAISMNSTISSNIKFSTPHILN
jgi:hypothetical protein